MRFAPGTTLAIAALAAAGLAQNPTDIPPGISRPAGNSGVFDVAKAPLKGVGIDIQQVSAQRLTSDAAGDYTIGLSMGALSSTFGGTGQFVGVLLGKYSVPTGAVSLSTLANAFNVANHHVFNLHVEPGAGRYGVTDRFDSQFNWKGVWFASRASAAVAFGAPVMVTNIQGATSGYADPAIGYVAGKLKLFYLGTIASQLGIYMDDLDISNLAAPKCVGVPVLCVVSPRAGTPNSPTPLTGPDGDVEGLWHADLTTNNQNDMYWANDLDPKTPSVPVFVSPAWKNNGGVIGGLLTSGNGPTWAQVLDAESAWLLGDEEAIGGKADIFGGSYSKSPATPNITIVVISYGTGKVWSTPGFFGQLYLGFPLPALPMMVMTHGSDQMAKLAFTIPNDPGLKGKKFPVQGLSLVGSNVLTATATWTSSAWLRIKP